MKPSRKHFLLGALAGSVLTLLVSVLGLLVGSKIYSNHVKATLEERIGPPPFPDSLNASYDWDAAPLDGTPQPMAALRDKTVVLTFWKPDCFSCTEQLEYLQSLANGLHDAPIEFALVSIGSQEATKQALSMLDVSLPVYVLEGHRPKVYETKTLPTTFVLSPMGKIAFRHAGIARWDDPAAAAYLRALAAEHVLTAAP
jgi:peroxiredoxin